MGTPAFPLVIGVGERIEGVSPGIDPRPEMENVTWVINIAFK
jgi:hypothetical protein